MYQLYSFLESLVDSVVAKVTCLHSTGTLYEPMSPFGLSVADAGYAGNSLLKYIKSFENIATAKAVRA